MLEVARQNEAIQQQKKDEFYARQAEADRRKALLEEEKERELSENRRKFAEREEYITNVRNTMTRNAQARVDEIQHNRYQKDKKIAE